MVEIEGRKRKQTFATVFCSPNTCLVGRWSGWIRFRFFVEVFASSLRRFRFTGVVGEVPWEQRDLCEVYKVYERRIAMLLKRIYFSVNKFPDFLVSSLMVFFLLFDVAREAFERHLLSSNRRRFATIKLVLSLSWLFSFCGFFVGVAPFMEFNLTSSILPVRRQLDFG